MTQRNGRCSNLIYNQIHGCGRRESSSCSFDHLSPSQMRQHGVIGSASKDAQSNNCLYPSPYPVQLDSKTESTGKFDNTVDFVLVEKDPLADTYG